MIPNTVSVVLITWLSICSLWYFFSYWIFLGFSPAHSCTGVYLLGMGLKYTELWAGLKPSETRYKVGEMKQRLFIIIYMSCFIYTVCECI